MKKGMDNVNRRFKDLDPDKIEEGAHVTPIKECEGGVYRIAGYVPRYNAGRDERETD